MRPAGLFITFVYIKAYQMCNSSLHNANGKANIAFPLKKKKKLNEQ